MLSQSDPRMAQRYAHLLPENLNVVNYVEGKGIATILLQSEENEKGAASATPLIFKRPQWDSNPCYRLERAMS